MSTEIHGVSPRRRRSGHGVKGLSVGLVLAVSVLPGADNARAADFNWNNPGTGLYTDPANWNPAGGPPDSFFDGAIFNLFDSDGHEATFGVGTVNTERLEVLESDVLFNGAGLSNTTYQLFSFAVGDAAVIGSASGASLTLKAMTVTSSQPVRIGVAAGETGSLTMVTTQSCLPLPIGCFATSSSAWTGSSAFIVGKSGTGTLDNGGQTLEASSLVAGQNGGSMGTVTGGFDISGDITIADAGTATLTSGNLNGVNLFIGKSAGSNGTVDIIGPSTLTGSLYVGGTDLAAGGTGVLDITTVGNVTVAQDMKIWGGGDVTLSSGTLDVSGQLVIPAAPTPNLSLLSPTSTLRTGQLFGVPNSVDWQAGTIEITNGILDIGIASQLGPTVTVDLDKTLIVSDQLTVGRSDIGSLTLDDSTGTGGQGGVTANDIVVGDQALSDGTVDILGPTSAMTATNSLTVGNFGTGQLNLSAGTLNTGGASLGTQTSGMGTVALAGASSQWTDTGTVTLGNSGNGVLTLGSGASLVTSESQAAKVGGGTATITVNDPGTTWANSGSMRLGGDAIGPGGSGTMTVNDGSVTVGGTLKVWDSFTLNVNGGSVDPAVLDVSGTVNRIGGTLDASSAVVVIRDGGVVNGGVTGNPSTTVTVEGPGGSWLPGGNVLVSGSASGTNTLGTLDLAGGTVVAPEIDLGDQPFTGFGTLLGIVRSSNSITATGDLTLGDSNVIGALDITGSINVDTHTVTLNQLGFFGLSQETDIGPGGTLTVPNGMVLPAAGNILATGGAFDGRFVAQAGSTTVAFFGDVSIGDAAAVNGFASAGTTLIAGNTLTLLDANDAVFDSQALVMMGDGPGSDGNLTAANGLTLDFGGNITGFGTVNTPNDPFKPLTNNGHITGNSALEPITLTGYVKGVGMLDNVVITGTDAPGFSPASVFRGSVGYVGTLEIEIGGTSPGDFDRIIHSGTASLGGTLDLALINAFSPMLGDTFQFITAGSVTGTFANVLGTDLGGGRMFDVSYSATDVTLQVISSFLEGDLNGDGFVGIADLNIVLGNWNLSVPPGDPLLGDPSGDGFVGIADLNVVLGNWNAGTPPSDNTNIPEPASLMLLSLGLIAHHRRRH